MTIFVDLDPATEANLRAEAERRGVSPSAVIQEALAGLLRQESPAALLRRVRSGTPMGDPDASEHVSERMKAKLGAQCSN